MIRNKQNPPDTTKTLTKGRNIRLNKVAGTWRLIGADGASLFFLAEVADAGGIPSGVVPNQLTQANLFGRRVVDDRMYTVVAHGGSVEMDPARGYSQTSA
ncbi:MAG: hypothetical protein WBD40_04155 [Tepidisphaeraceae bacterium]